MMYSNCHYFKFLFDFVVPENLDNTISPVATGGFGGLSTPKQTTKPPKSKYETV